MSLSYKIMKVFDSQWNPGMPDDVKAAFFSFYECGNDVLVYWTVQEDDSSYDSDDEFSIKRRLVDNWLIKNGAEPRQEGKYNGETVLIKHWW
jgi:hypothetical protein